MSRSWQWWPEAMTDPETYEGYPNRETWAVALTINNDRDWQQMVHHHLRFMDFSVEIHRELIEASLSEREVIKARCAGVKLRGIVEDLLLAPVEYPLTDHFLRLTQRQLDAIKAIGSMWRVDWDHLGELFLSDLEDT